MDDAVEVPAGQRRGGCLDLLAGADDRDLGVSGQ